MLYMRPKSLSVYKMSQQAGVLSTRTKYENIVYVAYHRVTLNLAFGTSIYLCHLDHEYREMSIRVIEGIQQTKYEDMKR